MNVFYNLKQLLLLIALIVSLGMSVESSDVAGYPQKIYTIRANMSSSVVMNQVLSQNQVFGFETLSTMSMRKETNIGQSDEGKASAQKLAYEVGVNGMFYDSFGHPAGILIRNGELITSKSIGTPLFLVNKNGTVSIQDVTLNTGILYKNNKYSINEVNDSQEKGKISIYTPWFGETDRMRVQHTVIVVKNNKIIDRIETDSPFSTQKALGGLHNGNFLMDFQSLTQVLTVDLANGQTNSLTNDQADDFSKDITNELNFSIGDQVEFVVEGNIDISEIKEGFQTGGWLVKDGVNVAKPYENFIGLTDSLQPRTAIGITDKNTLIIKVVDGRRPGVSTGLTGSQLADLFVQEKCISAAYLDGGASTTLVQGGKVTNNPSLGEEKKISHGLFFDRDYSKVLAK